MLTKIITLTIFQLLAFPVLASDQTIAQKQSAAQSGVVEKLKAHIPTVALHKIIMDYVGNEYSPTKLDGVGQINIAKLSQNGIYLIALPIEDNYWSPMTVKIYKFENDSYKFMHEITIPAMSDSYINNQAAISDDGRFIAFETTNHDVHIWQLIKNRYQKKQIEKQLYRSSYGLEFFGNSNMLGRSTSDTITIWKLSEKTDTFMRESEFVVPDISSIAFSSNGKYIAATNKYGELNLWKPFQSSNHPFVNWQDLWGYNPIVSISPNGRQLATSSYKGIHLFTMQNDSLHEFQTIKMHLFNNGAVKFSPDERSFAMKIGAYPKDLISLWKLNPKSTEYVKAAEIVAGNEIDLIGLSPNNSIITVNNNTHELVILENQKELLERDAGDTVNSAAQQEKVTEVD